MSALGTAWILNEQVGREGGERGGNDEVRKVPGRNAIGCERQVACFSCEIDQSDPPNIIAPCSGFASEHNLRASAVHIHHLTRVQASCWFCCPDRFAIGSPSLGFLEKNRQDRARRSQAPQDPNLRPWPSLWAYIQLRNKQTVV
ncbi:hypothetical protein KCV07_g239, partial [Aureobasidium melanogenum]